MYRYAMRSHILVVLALSLLMPTSGHAMQQNERPSKDALIAGAAIAAAGVGLIWLVHRSLSMPSSAHVPSRPPTAPASAASVQSANAVSGPSSGAHVIQPSLLSVSDTPTSRLLRAAKGSELNLGNNKSEIWTALDALKNEGADLNAVDPETKRSVLELAMQHLPGRSFILGRMAIWLVCHGAGVTPRVLEAARNNDLWHLSYFGQDIVTDEALKRALGVDPEKDVKGLLMWRDRIKEKHEPSTTITATFLDEQLALVRGEITVKAIVKGDLGKAQKMFDLGASVNAELPAAVQALCDKKQAELAAVKKFQEIMEERAKKAQSDVSVSN